MSLHFQAHSPFIVMWASTYAKGRSSTVSTAVAACHRLSRACDRTNRSPKKLYCLSGVIRCVSEAFDEQF